MMIHMHPESHMTLLLSDHVPAIKAQYKKGDHPE